MRGAHFHSESLRIQSLGSPPHARGPHNVIYRTYGKYGITPACAGPTLLKKCRNSGVRDHPRMRGAHGKHS